jgi:hypothetical protein
MSDGPHGHGWWQAADLKWNGRQQTLGTADLESGL